jgi:hypothetical protein
MRFAAGLLCVAACATKPVPPPPNPQTVAKQERALPRSTVTVTPAPAREPRPRAAPEPLTPDVVLATIRGRYISGVERCYRRHAKKHGSTRSVVLVSFTVDPKGRARDGEARGVTGRVDGCIAAQVKRWRFPVPHEHREARFALGLEVGVY